MVKRGIMKKVYPFSALLYNASQVSSYTDVVSQPYDVITPPMREACVQKSPYHFCHIDLPVGDDPYAAAAETFLSWLEQEVVVQDGDPALYVYDHKFSLPSGELVTRRGFFVSYDLSSEVESGAGQAGTDSVKAHEKTLEAPKKDRFLLTEATGAQLSPIFCLYDDREQELDQLCQSLVETTPLIHFVSDDHHEHSVWRLTDEKAWEKFDEVMTRNPLFIADGHHRFETAKNYLKSQLEENPNLPENAPCRRVMLYVANSHDPGLCVLAIHRGVQGLPDFSPESFLAKASEVFDVKEVNAPESSASFWEETLQKKSSDHSFAMLSPDGKGHLLSLSKEKWREICQDYGVSSDDPRVDLDVTVLHQVVFGNLLGMSEEDQAAQKNLVYIKDTGRSINYAWSEDEALGKGQASFLLNPIDLEQLTRVANAGLTMPQKSTFFYPKVLSGVLWHRVK
jgi:uncharacterized protein (DUF1015 family)